MDRTIIGVFDHFQNAERVVSELGLIGCSKEDISLITPDEKDRLAQVHLSRTSRHPDEVDTLTNRVGTGASLGGVGGALLAMGSLVVPGIGPLLAVGPLVAALGGASLGGAIGGFVGALSAAGVSHEDAHFYAETLRRGSTVVAVSTDEANAERIIDVMQRFGAVDIDQRAELYRRQGFERFDETRSPLDREEIIAERERYMNTSEREVNGVPLRRPVYTGGVRVIPHVRAWRAPAAKELARPAPESHVGSME